MKNWKTTFGGVLIGLGQVISLAGSAFLPGSIIQPLAALLTAGGGLLVGYNAQDKL